jgi:nitric oxide reductase NorQ protein
VERRTAAALVKLAERVRLLREQGLAEAPSTRLLVSTARLIASGIPPAHAAGWGAQRGAVV